ncbi:MAG: hypothetical protein WCG08_15115 [Paludibacter sp.]
MAPSLKTTPAPIKLIPVTILDAIRSPVPIDTERTLNKQELTHINIMVLKPAG